VEVLIMRSGIALSILIALVAACSLQVDEREFSPSVDADTADQPNAGVQLDPVQLQITEGEAGTLTVRATAELAGDVTVDLSADPTVGLSATDVVLSPSQPMVMITVTALDDDDAQPGSATVTAQSPILGLTTSSVSIVEDDELEIEVDQPGITVTETTDGQIRVRLTALPPGDITVDVESGDTSIASVTPGSLFFDADNWNDFQTVTVSGERDPDTENDTTPIELSGTGLTTVNVPATVNDVDRLAIETSTGTIMVTEEGPIVMIGVRLTQEPPGNVMVTAASGNAGVRVDPSSVQFTPQNYSQFQNLDVTALTDPDTAGFTTMVTLSTLEPNVDDLPFSVVVIDDDEQEILEDAADPLVLDEGEQVVFNATLAYQPTSDIVVGVVSTNPAAATVTVAQGALTFTPTNWNQPHPVTVTGVDDANVVLDSTIIRMTASPLQTDVDVDVVDLDDQDILIASQPTMVTEGGIATFTVRLAFQPAGATTVNISSNNDTAIAVTAGASLNFTPLNYAMPQMVTLSGLTDVDLIEESATITVQGSGLPTKTFTVTVDETSVVEIQASTVGVTVTEQAAAVSFNVVLSNPPVGTLTVDVGASNPGISASPPQLSFNAGNYTTPQQVMVSALMDDDTAGFSGTVGLTATGAMSDSVNVTVLDDDQQAILEFAPATVDVIDPDISAPIGVSFGVRLAFRPQSDVTISAASLQTGVATVSPPSRTFTTTNWNIEQNFTVTAVADNNLADGTATVRLTSPTLTMVDVAVAVDDQDVQVVETNVPTMTITEGTSANLGVRLRYQPAAATTVSLSSNSGEVTVPATLGFSTSDWNTFKNASVGSMVDGDQANDTATITLGNFDAPATTMVGVTVTDNTIVAQFGWPTPAYTGTATLAGEVVAYQMQNMSLSATLDRVGLVAGGAGTFRLAIYADAGTNVPTSLVFAGDVSTSPGAGTVTVDVVDQLLTSGTYWIAVRTTGMSIGTATAAQMNTARRCVRSADITNINNAWPLTFGSCAVNSIVPVQNLFITTFRQP
jgi:hypothetical protein